jgi:flagellar capping protein FliD
VDSADERLAMVEGRVLEQSMRIDDVREAVSRLEVRIGSLEERFDRRFELLEHRFTQLEQRLDQRFTAIDARFLAIDGRLDRMTGQLSQLIIGVAVAAIAGLLGMVTAMIR